MVMVIDSEIFMLLVVTILISVKSPLRTCCLCPIRDGLFKTKPSDSAIDPISEKMHRACVQFLTSYVRFNFVSDRIDHR